jgi:hypothetical protein
VGSVKPLPTLLTGDAARVRRVLRSGLGLPTFCPGASAASRAIRSRRFSIRAKVRRPKDLYEPITLCVSETLRCAACQALAGTVQPIIVRVPPYRVRPRGRLCGLTAGAAPLALPATGRRGGSEAATAGEAS